MGERRGAMLAIMGSRHAEKALIDRVVALESEVAVRRLMAEYVRTRDFEVDTVSNVQLFTRDAVWEGLGSFAALLGSHRGRLQLEQRLISSRAAAFVAGYERATTLTRVIAAIACGWYSPGADCAALVH